MGGLTSNPRALLVPQEMLGRSRKVEGEECGHISYMATTVATRSKSRVPYRCCRAWPEGSTRVARVALADVEYAPSTRSLLEPDEVVGVTVAKLGMLKVEAQGKSPRLGERR